MDQINNQERIGWCKMKTKGIKYERLNMKTKVIIVRSKNGFLFETILRVKACLKAQKSILFEPLSRWEFDILSPIDIPFEISDCRGL